MAIQSSGLITLADIQTEFGGSNPIGLNEYYRNGAYVTANNTGVPTSGTISLQNFYGAEKLFYLVISSSAHDANISTLALNAGWDWAAPIHATINSDVYLWASSTGTYGLTIPAGMPVLTVINNGKIMGCGGTGGAANSGAGAAGGTALNVLSNVLFTNSSGAYIAGGGGGGGGGLAWTYGVSGGGGGGAGGGTGGIGIYAAGSTLAGGAGGAIGASGAKGDEASNLNQGSMGGGGGGAGGGGGGFYDSSAGSGFTGDRGAGGGGGGRILSGTGGVAGIGQRTGNEWCNGGAGGSANSVGSNSGATSGAANRGGAGGGGWGASGGSAGGSGGAGGKAIFGISLISLTNAGTIYGATA